MTRGEIKKFCKDNLNEEFGSPGSDSPFSWDNLINLAADDLCRGTDCLWMDFRVPLTSGKSVYNCLPLYKIRKVQAYFPIGSGTALRNLEIMQPDWLPYSYSDSDINPQSGVPGACAVKGTNQIVVYPVPNYTLSGGLVLSGYGVPGDNWPLDTDDCPLPNWSHMAVAYGAMMDRAIKIQMPDGQFAKLASRYKQMRGQLEAEAATNTRAKAIQKGDGMGGNPSSYSPLDL